MSLKHLSIASALFLLVFGAAAPAVTEAGATAGGSVVTVGAVTMEKRPSYYFVTMDFTQGRSHRQVGEDYGRAMQQVYPDWEKDAYGYLFTAATGQGLWGNTLNKRLADIKPQLDQEYRDEIEGFASTLKDLPFEGLFSHEDLAFALNLMPDVVRTSACSGLGVWGERSSLGTNMVHRNLDWFGGLFDHPFPYTASVTRMIVADPRKPATDKRSIYQIGLLGHLGVLTAIAPDVGIMAAILDSGVSGAEYESKGRHSYNFDLRRAMETQTSIAKWWGPSMPSS